LTWPLAPGPWPLAPGPWPLGGRHARPSRLLLTKLLTACPQAPACGAAVLKSPPQPPCGERGGEGGSCDAITGAACLHARPESGAPGGGWPLDPGPCSSEAVGPWSWTLDPGLWTLLLGPQLGGPGTRDQGPQGGPRVSIHTRLGSARFGSARLGSARRGSARLGSIRLRSARLALWNWMRMCGLARMGHAAGAGCAAQHFEAS